MWKVIGHVTRKAGTSIEDFRNYYESKHALLGNECMANFAVDYRRNYIAETFGHPNQGGKMAPLGYDCITEVWFKDRESIEALHAYMARPEIAEITTADEARFTERALTRIIIAEEVPERFSFKDRPTLNLLPAFRR